MTSGPIEFIITNQMVIKNDGYKLSALLDVL